MTLLLSITTFVALCYVTHSFARLYDLMTEHNKRIAIACVCTAVFLSMEHGTRSFCTVFQVAMPDTLPLLEFGSTLFLVAWMGLTLLEIKDTLLLDLQDSQNHWKKRKL